MKLLWRGHVQSRLIAAAVVLFSVVWLFAATGVFGVDFPRDTPTEAHVPGRLLVRFKAGVSREAQQQALDSGGLTATLVGEIEALYVQIVEVPEVQLEAALESYRANPQIAYAELDTLMSVALVPNDPFYAAQQYGPQIIQADRAWDTAQGAGVVIAVVDTGVDFGHPDLQGQLRSDGYDFVNNDRDPADDHGHGTHVSGIAAAVTNNGVGIAGIAPKAKILPVKVMDCWGSGENSAVAQGIVYAADHGAQVINLSLGGAGYSQTMQNAVDYAWAKGALVVAAAGNGNSSLPFYPAWYAHVLAVASTDSYGARAASSNFGDRIAVAAPGVGIYSTYWTAAAGSTYEAMSGTSMAAPHVAGLAALLFGKQPGRTNTDVRTLIERSADDLGTPGWDHFYGSGRINAYRAVIEELNPSPTPGPTPTSWPAATPTPMPTPRPQTPEPTPDPGLRGVGRLVWNDLDGNGAKETWEPGLAGVTVRLWSPGPNGQIGGGDDLLAATAVTGADGRYNFIPPAGDYYVEFVPSAGWTFSPQGYMQPASQQWSYDTTQTDSDVNPATGRTGLVGVDPADYNGAIDAGLHQDAVVGGRVWLEGNEDGIQQPEETGLGQVPVNLLDSGGRLVETTIAGADGRYQFTVMRVPGVYRVQVVPSVPEYRITRCHQGGDAALDSDVDPLTGLSGDIVLEAGGQHLHVDAGLKLDTGQQVVCYVAPSQKTVWNGMATLPKFAPALGTLTGVRMTVHQWARREVYYENQADSQGSYRFSGGNSVTVKGPDGVSLVTAAPIGWSSGLWGWDGRADFVGPSGLIEQARYFSSQSGDYARPADFLASAPGETISLTLMGESSVSFNASGPYYSQLRSDSGALVCAVYAYSPACQSPVRPITSIAVVAGTSDVQLSWTDDPASEGYEVHRAAEPHFEAGEATLLARLPAGATAYIDRGALQAGSAPIFYLLRAVNCAGNRTSDSTGVGVFTFAFGSGLLSSCCEPAGRTFLPIIRRG